jgi:hypothetical protein
MSGLASSLAQHGVAANRSGSILAGNRAMRSTLHAAKLLPICFVILASAAPRSARAAAPAFAYVNANPDQQPNSVAAIHLGGSGQGTLVPGSPYLTGGFGLASAAGAEFAHRIEVSRSRNLLFAANDGSGTISAFSINPQSGSLAAVPGSPFAFDGWAPFSGISLAVSNDGRFLYASGTTILSFAIAANGSLSEIGSEWVLGDRVGGIAVSNDNRELFLSTAGGVDILNTGESGLTNDQPAVLDIGSTPTDLRLDATGSRLWVGTKNGGILGYSLTSGVAAIAPGAPFFSAVSNLSGLSADFYGRFLIAYSPIGPRLLGARSNLDGSLELGPNSPIVPAFAAASGALTPDGNLLLLTDAHGQLDAWTTEGSGALTHAAGYPLATHATPGFPSIATFPDETPTPAPAVPVWLVLALASILGLLGAQRALAHASAPD